LNLILIAQGTSKTYTNRLKIHKLRLDLPNGISAFKTDEESMQEQKVIEVEHRYCTICQTQYTDIKEVILNINIAHQQLLSFFYSQT